MAQAQSQAVITRWRKSVRVHRAERLRVERRCSRQAVYRDATFENEWGDESGCPACGRIRLRPPTRDAAVPMKDPCPGSNGSPRRVYDDVQPKFSKGDVGSRFRDTGRGIPPT